MSAAVSELEASALSVSSRRPRGRDRADYILAISAVLSLPHQFYELNLSLWANILAFLLRSLVPLAGEIGPK